MAHDDRDTALNQAGIQALDILVVEDDLRTREIIRAGLTDNGHRVRLAESGSQALHVAAESEFDVAILDRMLPDINGLEVLGELRRRGTRTPILLLSALGSVNDRVSGLDSGADDYLVKPFAMVELLARVGALHRRPPLGAVPTRIMIRDIEVDMLGRQVWRRGQALPLHPREFDLLVLLARNAGRPVTRKMFLEQVWRIHYDPTTNVVESHISRLRSKLRQGFDDDPIETIQNVGYRMRTCA